ncbi:hypothetical protein GCM10010339_82290 [Streptomyces alanosinicus]|uniref:Uncharacterized protein n=1 Tax=Streptomyces alanosinicus TaxID=68171 RepID=A0A918YSN6_9ACTN|nr:hypothetical protein GCM10010339_82290 [Streptomyces alanosinicus]
MGARHDVEALDSYPPTARSAVGAEGRRSAGGAAACTRVTAEGTASLDSAPPDPGPEEVLTDLSGPVACPAAGQRVGKTREPRG